MGCVTSNEKNGQGSHMTCMKDTQTTNSFPPLPINDLEVDLSHFSQPKEILGIGGFGIVRRVEKITCSDHGKNYAMKSISKQTVLSRPSGTRAVMTELKTLILISNCEHICGLKYAFQDDSFLYMIFEYASGGDMRYNLRKAHQCRFNESVSKLIIRQVIAAIQHCHNSFILHRDVKPENILLFDDGRVKLTDFGVAKILPDIEQCRSTSGTHGYMAPEIYTDDHSHGSAFDWFCVGITLHEFLSGRRPYEANRLQRYYANDCMDRLELDYLSRMPISAECISFVREILRPDPIFRLGSSNGEIEIMQHSWMRNEKRIDYTEAVALMRRELPGFREIIDLKRSNRIVHKINISHDEAISLVRQHQEPCLLTPDMQTVFRDFEFNTKVSSPLFQSTSTADPLSHSIAATTLPLDSSTCRSGSVSAANGHLLGIRPQQNLRDSFDLDSNSSGQDNNDDYHDEENSFHDDNDANFQSALNSHIMGRRIESESYDPDEMKECSIDNTSFRNRQLCHSQNLKPDDSQQSHSSTPSTSIKRTRGRPHSDRIISYHNTKRGSYSEHSAKKLNKDRYKPQRRLSYPSPNMQQDDSPYKLYQTANHNPKAISWRQVPSLSEKR